MESVASSTIRRRKMAARSALSSSDKDEPKEEEKSGELSLACAGMAPYSNRVRQVPTP